jgi:sortase A
MRSFFRRLALVLALLAVAGWAAYRGWFAYVAAREAASPSTAQVLVTRDGRTIPLEQPAGPLTAGRAAGPAPRRPILPPERVSIPALGADWPVVLATPHHLPRFRGVGWLLGSAFPGAPGNLVLIGNRDGAAATFTRLAELEPGDVFTVTSLEATYSYRVRASFQTTLDDVEVLAPTEAATATLITCAGSCQIVAADLLDGE